MQVSAGSTQYQVYGDKIVFQLAGHTDQLPKLLEFRRKIGRNGSRSTYTIRAIVGVLQADGSTKNIIVDLETAKVDNATLANYQTAFNAIRFTLASANFDSESMLQSVLPTAAAIAV